MSSLCSIITILYSCVNYSDCYHALNGCMICEGSKCIAHQKPVTPQCQDSFNNGECYSALNGTICQGGKCAVLPLPFITPQCGSSCTNNNGCIGAACGCIECRKHVCALPDNGMASISVSDEQDHRLHFSNQSL